MKCNLRPIALTLLVTAMYISGAARADDITIDPLPFVPSASRAEVRAELKTFKKSGVNPWSIAYNQLRNFQSTKTRAEVTAEYIMERDAVAAMNGEDSGSRYLAERRDAERSAVLLANKHREGELH